MADVYRDDESKYLKALTAEYPQIAFSKVIKSTSMESSDLFKSQKDLEETLVSLTRKGESTKWSFRSFKEVKEQLEKEEFIQDHFEWVLDGLVDKENELRKEVTHPSVEPEEVEKVVYTIWKILAMDSNSY
uniref:Uncharacterized protein n=1 Tax=Rhizophagus irregularis (strain DAOM 181602 / DAOM 197198 / MUCL 43194) TaxID=747089 RepID=U9TUM6_RHIID